MGLFKFKKKQTVIEERSDIERKFEEAGQIAGKKTGEFIQKSIDKFEDVKVKINADDKMEKVKELVSKAEDKVDQIVDKATKVSKDTYDKVKEKVGK